MKARILALEEENRSERLKRRDAEEKLGLVEREKEDLAMQVAKTKPREQELRERIAYFERVNLDL